MFGRDIEGTSPAALYIHLRKYLERLGIFSDEDTELGEDAADTGNIVCNEAGKISLSESLIQ